MLPSSPAVAGHFDANYQGLQGVGDSTDGLDFIDPENKSINYAHLLPTKVYVLWTTAQESRQGWWRSMFRKVVAHYSGGVTHIELAFEFYNHKIIAVASYQNRNVEMFIKIPERGAYDQVYGKWDFEQLALNDAERFHAWRFCLSQYGKPYNARGLYSFLPCCGCCIFCFCSAEIEDGSSWFCSQLVVAAVQYALQHNERLRTAVMMISAARCRPNDALNYFRQLGLIVQTTGLTVMGNPAAQLAAWWQAQQARDEERRHV